MAILGLDISTSITGATVVDDEGNMLCSQSWDTRNKNQFPTIYDKANFIKKRLWQIDDVYHIDKIFVEQSLQSFRSGFSSAKTLSVLSRFNGIVSWLCFDIMGKMPEMIAASSARKEVGLKISRDSDTKKQILEFFLDNNPDIEIEYTYRGNPKPIYKDMADSWIIAVAGYKKCLKERVKS